MKQIIIFILVIFASLKVVLADVAKTKAVIDRKKTEERKPQSEFSDEVYKKLNLKKDAYILISGDAECDQEVYFEIQVLEDGQVQILINQRVGFPGISESGKSLYRNGSCSSEVKSQLRDAYLQTIEDANCPSEYKYQNTNTLYLTKGVLILEHKSSTGREYKCRYR